MKRYEQALQSVDARVTIPYWNWGLGDISETTELFQDARMGGMGSGGASGREVASGYFALNPNNQFNPNGWAIHSAVRPFGQGLQRNQTLNTGTGWPSGSTITNILSENNYNNFRPALEDPHGLVHGRMGRDMGQMTSPNDPIFFMHHAQIDHIWAIWQRDHPGSANYNPNGSGGVGHRLNDPMWPWDGGLSQTTAPGIAGLLPQYPSTDIVRPVNVINHHEMGYCYDDDPDCPCPIEKPEEPPTWLRGEESWPTWDNDWKFTTALRGEEGPPIAPITTLALGEEGPRTFIRGEEAPRRTRFSNILGIANPFGDF